MLLKFSSHTQRLVLQIRTCKGKKSERTEVLVIFLSVRYDSLNIQRKWELFQITMKLMETETSNIWEKPTYSSIDE